MFVGIRLYVEHSSVQSRRQSEQALLIKYT